MRYPGPHEISMNLITDDERSIFGTKLIQALKLFGCPDAPDGVMRAAQDEQLRALGAERAFECVEVDVIGAILVCKRHLDEASPVLHDNGEEGVIDRRLDENGILWIGEGPHAGCERIYDSRGDNDIIVFYVDDIVRFEPRFDSVEISAIGICVSKDAVL